MSADFAQTVPRAAAAPVARRRRRRIKGSSIAILVFLTMCAAFFAIPLYVVIVTSLKTIEQITMGDIFSLPQPLTVEPWWKA